MIRAAVLGHPIEHSLSPMVHGVIYRELGVPFQYEKFDLIEGQARDFLSENLPSWNGFSLTMPLKEVGFTLNLAVEDQAHRAHSINTITREGCYNTDIPGLVRVIREEGHTWRDVVLIGAGATARSALVAVESLFPSSNVRVYRRDASRDGLLPELKDASVVVKSFGEWNERLFSPSTLVISTLPSSAQSTISAALAGFEGMLIDFSYAPWPSTLAAVVKGRVISGLPILVSQAVEQAQIFSGVEFDRDAMYRSVLPSTVRLLARSEEA